MLYYTKHKGELNSPYAFLCEQFPEQHEQLHPQLFFLDNRLLIDKYTIDTTSKITTMFAILSVNQFI